MLTKYSSISTQENITYLKNLKQMCAAQIAALMRHATPVGNVGMEVPIGVDLALQDYIKAS
jgi:hypothetical protein